MNSSLYFFRSFVNKTQFEIADELSLTYDEYEAMEAGVENIDEAIAEKLSRLYNAPPAIFLQDTRSQAGSFNYSHNTFNGSNAYVHNMYQQDMRVIQMLTAAKDEEIQLLKEEISRLRQQNNQLVGRLIGKG